MDNPIVNTDATVLIRRVALAVVGLMAVILLWIWGVSSVQISDPYIQKVLSLPGDSTRGHAIFEMNCAGCHVQEADHQIGPSLKDVSQRKSQVSIIRQVIGGKTPPMPQFQPNPQDMADLLTYLEQM
ncbi:c-type cytochrome [Lyngbya sp. CCY1209]|uniref:c-type cytochrome n=1 Tax=Lyngbya sp. CCY1209 TaxID=2886103 RepID=UPI002D1FD5CB|nr:cytochrome c [Lyngbya sp. CCY1209]